MSEDVYPVGVLKPKTMLVVHMTRGERNPAEELYKYFGRFESVVIDVDGEKHEYDADTLIALLEDYENGTCAWGERKEK